MPSWGYIAAGIVFGLILFPIFVWALWKLFVLLLRKKLLGFLEGMQAMASSGAPPLRITMVGLESPPDWVSESHAQSATEALLAEGFVHGGDFQVPEAGGATMRAFLSSDGTAAAFLCKHPAKPECFLDVIREYEDGTTLTVSDAQDMGLESCPAHPNIKFTGQPLSVLLQELENRSQDRVAVTFTVDQLTSAYKRGYAALMDWRVEKGGITREEMLANAGREMEESEIPQALEQFRQQNLEQVQELLMIRYSEQTQLPVARWEEVRDRLVFVHDRLQIDDVRALAENMVYWLESPLPQPGKPGREGFQQMLNHLPPGIVVEKIAEVSGSIPADVYLEPEEPIQPNPEAE